MRWKLFNATWICAWRRLRPVLAANPIVALVAFAAVVAIPAACIVAGLRLADEFAAAAAGPGFGRALGLGIATTGLVAGAAFALLAPRPSVLGGELVAAPLGRRSFVLATVVGPTLVAGLALTVLALCFLVPLAGAAGVAVAIGFVASGLLGAALGEGLDLCAKREPAGVVVVVAVAAAWGASGRSDAELGPGALVASALGRPDARWHGVVLLALALGAAFGWLAAAARPRPAARAGGCVRAIALPRSAVGALGLATALQLTRHPQLRLNGVAGVVVPVALSCAMAAALGVDGAPLVGFGAGLALTAAVLFPAAARGVTDDARWLLGTAPGRSSIQATAITGAGVTAAGAVVAVTAATVAPLARADLGTYGQLEAASAFVLGCAAFAGALVPWRPDHVVQQIASYGTLFAVAVAAWALASRLEPLAVTAGLGETSFGLVVGNAVLVAGVAGSAAIAR